MALTTIDDRLLNTHWFVLTSKIKIIDKWFNRSQETETLLNWSNGDLRTPTTPYHMNFHHSSLTIRVNQLKTNHPQPSQPQSTTMINQLITIQSHDNHATTPERNPNQESPITIQLNSISNHSLTEITNHNQSPDSQSNQFKMTTPNHQQSPHDLKSKSNRGEIMTTWPHENHTNIDNPNFQRLRISQQSQSHQTNNLHEHD